MNFNRYTSTIKLTQVEKDNQELIFIVDASKIPYL